MCITVYYSVLLLLSRERDKMFALRIAGRCSQATLRNFSTFSMQNSSKTVARFPRKNCHRFYQTETKAWRTWEGTTKAPGITGKILLLCLCYFPVETLHSYNEKCLCSSLYTTLYLSTILDFNPGKSLAIRLKIIRVAIALNNILSRDKKLYICICRTMLEVWLNQIETPCQFIPRIAPFSDLHVIFQKDLLMLVEE